MSNESTYHITKRTLKVDIEDISQITLLYVIQIVLNNKLFKIDLLEQQNITRKDITKKILI